MAQFEDQRTTVYKVDPEHPEAEVGERVSVGEDGPISEWTVPFGAVLAFLAE